MLCVMDWTESRPMRSHRSMVMREPNRNMQKDLSSQKTKLIRLLIVRIRLLNVQKKSASNADQQAARAKSLADHPPKIVTVDDTNYWAFWDEEANDYMPSSVRSDGGPIFATFDIDPATMLLGVNYQPGYGHGSEFELKDDGHLYYEIND